MLCEKRTEKLAVIRNDRKVPGVIYGKKMESTPVQVDYKEFLKTYRQYGKSMSFKIKLGGKNHTVYFKAIQVDPINQLNFLHFDLQKVSVTDTITAQIPLYLIGKDIVEKKGLVVQQLVSSVETEFPVSQGISNFELNVSELEGNDTLHIKDIELPSGFKILNNADQMIVNVSYPHYDEEETTDEVEEDVEVEAIKQKGDAEDSKDN